jgi:NAD(P)-dependent dehydrogenase (short-subunit alcohol dehydrogenase family)
MTERDMTGQVAVITGASSGIGAAAARQLHQLGATVVVIGRAPDRTAAVAPFLLTALLKGLLTASAPSRVITTASVANLTGFVRTHDLETTHFFVGSTVYGTTKLENILFTRELGRRLAGDRVLATCFNPGVVATDLGRGNLSGAMCRSPLRQLMRSAEGGADTLVWLATQPAERLKQGGYNSNRRPGLVNAQALSGRLARQLWDRTENLLATAAS